MPINVFGNSSYNSEQKIDTSLFVQKPYLRTNYIEANIEEDIDLKIQYKIKNLPDPISIREAVSKNSVDNLFNDSSIIKNTEHIDLNDRNITNARFIQVNQLPQIDSHLTAKLYVDNSIDETSLLRLDPNETLDLDNQDSITLNSTLTEPKTIIEIPTKAYIDGLHDENERNRRDLDIDFYIESSDLVKNNQDNDFNDKKITNINSIIIDKKPSSDNEVINKKNFNDEVDKDTIVRLNDNSNDRYLKVNIKNSTYNLQVYNKILLTDTTIIKLPNSGGYLLQNWNIKCNDRNNQGKIQNFIGSTRTNSPTENAGATTPPPISDSFMYIETSSNNFGPNVHCSWERIDIIQISNITFYYNRFSTQGEFRAMGRFRIQILTRDNVWLTKFNIPKNDQYSNLATDWTILSLNITDEDYGVKFIYDQIDSAHCDMCFFQTLQ